MSCRLGVVKQRFLECVPHPDQIASSLNLWADLVSQHSLRLIVRYLKRLGTEFGGSVRDQEPSFPTRSPPGSAQAS